jgi:hypothetical protein
MIERCDKAESGFHEPDFEKLAYEYHLSGEAGLFRTACLHCGMAARFRLDSQDAVWLCDEDENEELAG